MSSNNNSDCYTFDEYKAKIEEENEFEQLHKTFVQFIYEFGSEMSIYKIDSEEYIHKANIFEYVKNFIETLEKNRHILKAKKEKESMLEADLEAQSRAIHILREKIFENKIKLLEKNLNNLDSKLSIHNLSDDDIVLFLKDEISLKEHFSQLENRNLKANFELSKIQSLIERTKNNLNEIEKKESIKKELCSTIDNQKIQIRCLEKQLIESYNLIDVNSLEIPRSTNLNINDIFKQTWRLSEKPKYSLLHNIFEEKYKPFIDKHMKKISLVIKKNNDLLNSNNLEIHNISRIIQEISGKITFFLQKNQEDHNIGNLLKIYEQHDAMGKNMKNSNEENNFLVKFKDDLQLFLKSIKIKVDKPSQTKLDLSKRLDDHNENFHNLIQIIKEKNFVQTNSLFTSKLEFENQNSLIKFYKENIIQLYKSRKNKNLKRRIFQILKENNETKKEKNNSFNTISRFSNINNKNNISNDNNLDSTYFSNFNHNKKESILSVCEASYLSIINNNYSLNQSVFDISKDEIKNVLLVNKPNENIFDINKERESSGILSISNKDQKHSIAQENIIQFEDSFVFLKENSFSKYGLNEDLKKNEPIDNFNLRRVIIKKSKEVDDRKFSYQTENNGNIRNDIPKNTMSNNRKFFPPYKKFIEKRISENSNVKKNDSFGNANNNINQAMKDEYDFIENQQKKRRESYSLDKIRKEKTTNKNKRRSNSFDDVKKQANCPEVSGYNLKNGYLSNAISFDFQNFDFYENNDDGIELDEDISYEERFVKIKKRDKKIEQYFERNINNFRKNARSFDLKK